MENFQKRTFSPSRLIGLGGVLFILIGCIVAGGTTWAFIHIPSLVFTLGVTFFALLATFGTDFLKFIPQSFLTFVSRNPEPNPKFAEIALFASRYLIGIGLVGMLIGLVQILNNLSDPSGIGAGMAVAILTILYALIVSEVFCAFLYKAYSSDGQATPAKPLPLKNTTLPAAVTALLLMLFFALLISFANYSG
jgi:flagellar motor component MotA